MRCWRCVSWQMKNRKYPMREIIALDGKTLLTPWVVGLPLLSKSSNNKRTMFYHLKMSFRWDAKMYELFIRRALNQDFPLQ